MKTLFLLRHAKSSWKNETLTDFERPLNSRGKHASQTIAAFLNQEKINPDLILSSTAQRARETIEIIRQYGAAPGDLRFDERIYEATVDRLLEVLAEIDNAVRVALIVGHNPGMEELIKRLTGTLEPMPTGALAKITLKISSWKNTPTTPGALDWVTAPKQLDQG